MAWKKGECGNRKGRPKVPEIQLLRDAIEATEKEEGKSLWKHLVEQCYKDNNVLRSVSNKFVPDMTMLKIDPESNEIIVKFKDK